MSNYFDYESDRRQRTTVLLLWVNRWQPISRLCANILREVSSYFPLKYRILGLLGREIAIFDVPTHSFQHASLSMQIPSTCVFADLTPKSILILGFHNESVYSLSFPKLEFTPLPEMHCSRGAPGITRCGAFIYVFGGSSGNLSSTNSSERYSRTVGTWEVLPNMRYPRSYFCPVLHEQRIFLPSYVQSADLESFDIAAMAYTTHCQLQRLGYMSVAAAIDGAIVWMTWQKVYGIELREEIEVREVHSLAGFSGTMQTKETPLVIGREVWFMLTDEFRVVKYNADDKEIQTIAEITTKTRQVESHYR